MTQEELKLVLDALKWCHGGEPCGTAEAIAVVEKALAQEQEPVVVVDRRLALRTWGFLAQECSPCAHEECQIEGKNFGVDTLCDAWNKTLDGTPTPPQRTWVGLTWEEIDECFKITPDQYLPAQIYRRIEAKLKQKNGYAEEKNT